MSFAIIRPSERCIVMVDAEKLKEIMGAEGSPTGRLVAMRRDPGDGQLETGVWYSNFTRVKDEAAARGIPFFAMWTNGDLCEYCKRFTRNILDDEFVKRMKTSGGLWWLGGSMDDNDEDRRDGRGFTWCMGPSREVNDFPFFAVSLVKDNKRLTQFFGSGSDYDLGKNAPEGTSFIVKRIAEILGDMRAAARHEEGRAHHVALDTVMHIRFNRDWDVQHIARFQHALNENGGHCVCQPQKVPDTMCMCKEFLEQSTPGFCRCGAFEKYAVQGTVQKA